MLSAASPHAAPLAPSVPSPPPLAGLLRGRGRQGVHLQGAKVHAAVGDFPEAPQALLGQVWPRERQDHPGLWQGGGRRRHPPRWHFYCPERI